MGWIYKITCDINDKVYIGKTEDNNPYDRWKEHQSDYKRRRFEKRPLYDAMNCYGVEHFHFDVIEEAENGQYLCDREKYYIEKYRAYVGYKDCKGYNGTLGGDGKSYLNLNEEKVINIHIQNNYIAGLTAKYFQVSPETIKKILLKHNIKWLSSSEICTLKFKQKYGGIIQMNDACTEIIGVYDSPSIIISLNPEFKQKTLKLAYTITSKTHKAYGYFWYRLNELPDKYKLLLENINY